MYAHTVTVEIGAQGVSLDDVVKALNKAGFTVGTPERKAAPGQGGKP